MSVPGFERGQGLVSVQACEWAVDLVFLWDQVQALEMRLMVHVPRMRGRMAMAVVVLVMLMHQRMQ